MSEQTSSDAMLSGGEGSSWLGSWIQSAKAKSVEAMSFVKRDLAEFTSTMHDDGVKVAASVKEKLTQENASAATEKVKKGMSSLLGGLSKALVVEPTDEYRVGRVVGGEAVFFDRHKARLHTAQIDPATYTAEPEGVRYEEWSEGFNVDNIKGDISQLLVSNPEVRSLYTQLVPFSVSNVDFWRRYYYKILLIEEDEERRRDLKKRAETATQQHNDTDTLGWDEDDEADDWTEVKLDTKDSTKSTSTLSSPDSSDTSHSAHTHTSHDSHTSDHISETTQLNEKTDVNVVSSQSNTAAAVLDGKALDEAEVKPSDVVVPQHDVKNKELKMVEGVKPGTNQEGNIKGDAGEQVKVVVKDKKEDSVLDKVNEISHKSEDHVDEAVTPSKAFTPISSPSSVQVGTSSPLCDKQTEDLSTSPETERCDSSEPSLTGWSALSDDLTGSDKQEETGESKQGEERGGSSQRNTPSSTKESLDEDWEKDFDVEVTEADMQAVRQAVTKHIDTHTADDKKSEDWEDW